MSCSSSSSRQQRDPEEEEFVQEGEEAEEAKAKYEYFDILVRVNTELCVYDERTEPHAKLPLAPHIVYKTYQESLFGTAKSKGSAVRIRVSDYLWEKRYELNELVQGCILDMFFDLERELPLTAFKFDSDAHPLVQAELRHRYNGGGGGGGLVNLSPSFVIRSDCNQSFDEIQVTYIVRVENEELYLRLVAAAEKQREEEEEEEEEQSEN
jgi:hypothetical protein